MGKNKEGIFGAVLKIQALSTLATVLLPPRFLLGRKACKQPSPRVRKSLRLFMKDTRSVSRKTPGRLSNQPVQPGAAPLRPGVQIWTPGTETARTQTFHLSSARNHSTPQRGSLTSANPANVGLASAVIRLPTLHSPHSPQAGE